MESQGGNEFYGTGSPAMKLTNMERWNTEQIGDFVRKLGFLDKEKDKEGGDKIKHFLHVNEVMLLCTDLMINIIHVHVSYMYIYMYMHAYVHVYVMHVKLVLIHKLEIFCLS